LDGSDVEKLGRSLEATDGLVASPGPLRGLATEAGAHRIQRDVAVHLEQVSLIDDVLGHEAPTEEVAATIVLPVEPLGVAAAKAPHPG
jgi:hypothetical protein